MKYDKLNGQIMDALNQFYQQSQEKILYSGYSLCFVSAGFLLGVKVGEKRE